MAEIDKNELARIVGHGGHPEHLHKEVSIIKDKKQHTIRIPAKFAEEANIDVEADSFVFELVPIEISEGVFEFTIEGSLKRGKNGDKKV